MKLSIRSVAIAALLSIALGACEKKDPEGPTTDPTGTGKVKLEFANKVGSSNLNLDTQSYTNEHGDTFTVSTFNYYISNIVLTGAKGSYTETESYHLIRQSDASSMSFDLADVPYDTYTSVTLMIGVDSARNTSGAQTGALDPANAMFWSWSTGYIMVKFEGHSPQSGAAGGFVSYHAGGYKGVNATQRMVTLTLPNAITVSKNGENHVHIDADVKALFKSPTVFDFSAINSIGSSGTDAKNYADNYANMLSVSYSGL